jgi:hypothetical protein
MHECVCVCVCVRVCACVCIYNCYFCNMMMSQMVTSTKTGLQRPWVEFIIGNESLIKGFDRAMPKMSYGERSLLFFTPTYAYGPEGLPPIIPPDAHMMFDVTVLGFRQRQEWIKPMIQVICILFLFGSIALYLFVLVIMYCSVAHVGSGVRTGNMFSSQFHMCLQYNIHICVHDVPYIQNLGLSEKPYMEEASAPHGTMEHPDDAISVMSNGP